MERMRKKMISTPSTGVDDCGKVVVNIDDENIISNILSRLPVKTLMQFKCVAKSWCNLIEDPYFIDLYRTKTSRQRLFVVVPRQRNFRQDFSFLIADVLYDGRGKKRMGKVASTINDITNKGPFPCSQVLGPVEGLICLISDSVHAACVFNISTREVTRWIKSTLLSTEEGTRRPRRNKSNSTSAYSFGYDPICKKHKVICKWVINKDDTAAYQLWEILTLGRHSAWRRMDQVPNCQFDTNAPSVYVNGFIYWYPLNFSRDLNVRFLLALCIGSEKFRRIRIPDSDQLNPYLSFNNECLICLVEVKSCVAILCRTSSYTIRLSIYEDDKWTRRGVILPVSWDERGAFFFHTAAGTDQLFLEIHHKNALGILFAISLYSYCFENKNFKQIGLNEIPLSASVPKSTRQLKNIPFSAASIPKYTRLCTSFYESIISFKESDKKYLIQPSTRS
ncbi:putative F-box protein At3g10240 [Papaver somniferum]|uniref:putative F-box protein At3g10240 n=1 Tax=Papaver somniferum TaxID=3469 RepID=UPI000E6F8075|nr:putative F-box protein At3g10240 [Papaver somniferum]